MSKQSKQDQKDGLSWAVTFRLSVFGNPGGAILLNAKCYSHCSFFQDLQHLYTGL